MKEKTLPQNVKQAIDSANKIKLKREKLKYGKYKLSMW